MSARAMRKSFIALATSAALTTSCATAQPARVTHVPVGGDAEEIAIWEGLLEEEKLAGDVYEYFLETHGDGRFSNIAAAERRHEAQVEQVLASMGRSHERLAKGRFASPETQSLYDELTRRGSASLGDAWQVGAEIEAMDIADIRRIRGEVSRDADVLDRLECGSRNHLRSFTSATGRYDLSPYLSEAEVRVVTSSEHERCGGGHGGGGHGGGGHGGGPRRGFRH